MSHTGNPRSHFDDFTADVLAAHRFTRRVRVAVYPMDARERERVGASRGAAELTEIGDSLVVGELDEEEVARLRADGVLVDVYGAAQGLGNAHRGSTDLGTTALWSGPSARSYDDGGPWPAAFEVQIDRPAATLLGHRPVTGVALRRACGGGRYVVQADGPAALSSLCARAGVGDAVRSRGDGNPLPPNATTWTAQLRRADDLAAVRARLEALGAVVVKADGCAIRFEVAVARLVEVRTWPEVHQVDAYVMPELGSDVIGAQIGLERDGAGGGPVDALPWDGDGEALAPVVRERQADAAKGGGR